MKKHKVFCTLFSSFVIAVCFLGEASCATGSSLDLREFFSRKPNIRKQPNQSLSEESTKESKDSLQDSEGKSADKPQNSSDEHSANTASLEDTKQDSSEKSDQTKNDDKTSNTEDSPSSKIEEVKTEFKKRFGGKIQETTIDYIYASKNEIILRSRLMHIISSLKTKEGIEDTLEPDFIKQHDLVENENKLAAFAKLIQTLTIDKLSQQSKEVLPEETKKENEPVDRGNNSSEKTQKKSEDEPSSSSKESDSIESHMTTLEEATPNDNKEQLNQMKQELDALKKKYQNARDVIEKFQALVKETETS